MCHIIFMVLMILLLLYSVIFNIKQRYVVNVCIPMLRKLMYQLNDVINLIYMYLLKWILLSTLEENIVGLSVCVAFFSLLFRPIFYISSSFLFLFVSQFDLQHLASTKNKIASGVFCAS